MSSSKTDKSTSRRHFLTSASAAISLTSLLRGSDWSKAYAAEAKQSPRRKHSPRTPCITFTSSAKTGLLPWDYNIPSTDYFRVANNWQAKPEIASDFFTPAQQGMIREIFNGLITPAWQPRFDKQLEDDCGGFGYSQSVSLLGEPGSGQFQFLLTGRHMTLRCDGDSAEHVAFGGPIFYGHDTGTFTEEPTHPDNVFWPQAIAANKVYEMLDRHQQAQSLVQRSPKENAISFHGKAERPGLSVTDLPMNKRTGKVSNCFSNRFGLVIRLKSINALPHKAESMHAVSFSTSRKT